MASVALTSAIPTWRGASGERQIPTWPMRCVSSAATLLPDSVSGQQLREWSVFVRGMVISLRIHLGVNFHRNISPVINKLCAGAEIWIVSRLNKFDTMFTAKFSNLPFIGLVVPLVGGIECIFAGKRKGAVSVIAFERIGHRLVSVLRRAVPAASCKYIYNGHITSSTGKCTMGTFFRNQALIGFDYIGCEVYRFITGFGQKCALGGEVVRFKNPLCGLTTGLIVGSFQLEGRVCKPRPSLTKIIFPHITVKSDICMSVNDQLIEGVM